MSLRFFARFVVFASFVLVCAVSAVRLSAQYPRVPTAIEVTDYRHAMVTAPPADLKLDPFYKKYADALGVPIAGSQMVQDDAVLMARDIVSTMLSKRADIRAEFIRRGGRVLIIAYEEGQTDLPEYRTMAKPAIDDPRLTPNERARYNEPTGIGNQTAQQYWNQRARGMGGIRTSCAEENLLGYVDTRYYGEHICVHEFSHGLMSAARAVDEGLYKELQTAYANAKEKGLFKGHYAENTIAEYWAEGTQWWFWSNYEWRDCSKGAPGVTLWAPDDLKTYDPALYAILEKVYDTHRIPADVYHGRNIRPARPCGAAGL
jgi:hypothetical protein